MWRILRAFAWLRWRVLVNSLELTGARDTMERLSIAVEQIGPLLAAALFIPSAIALLGIAGYSGYALVTRPDPPLLFVVLRYLLLAACALAVAGPIILPGGERTNAVRLLLLPIPRHTLYVAQAGAAITEPWILLALPVLVGLPFGLAAGGAWLAAVVAAAAGVLFLAALIGLSSVSTLALHLIVRDRRRGELVALLFIVLIPLVSMVPGMLESQRARDERAGRPSASDSIVPPWLSRTAARAYSLVPSELFTTATRGAVQRAPVAGAAVVALAASATMLHALGLLTFGRLLDSPSSSGRRRAGTRTAAWGLPLPGLSPGASAVAVAQVRLALRTPRGRSILLSPLIVFVMFAVMVRRSGSGMDLGFLELQGGLSLASFGSFVSLFSILPLAMNQFAIDGAGLTLALLSPLRDRELLLGKAVGNGAVAGAPAVLCLLVAFLVFPSGPLALWLTIPLALVATYLMAAPAAAALSALFPRAVDMNSIGRGSNAHGAAGLLGILAFVVAGAPCLLLTLFATRWLGRPGLAPLLMLVWCAAAAGISRLLFIAVEALFASRRENLAFVA